MNRQFATLKTITGIAPGFWSGKIHEPIFVLGCARSGTTLLSNVLGMHRDVAEWSEANEVWDPTGHPWRLSARTTPPVWIDPTEFTARWWQETEPRSQEIRAVFAGYHLLRGKSRFVNKTPYNTVRVAQLLQIFPDAKLIHIVRDGRAVVHSYLQREMKKIEKSPDAYREAGIPTDPDGVALRLASFWKYNIEEVERQDQSLSLTQRNVLMTMTYEELCANMHDTLRKICVFANLDPDRLGARVSTMKTPSQNFKWKSALDGALVEQLVAAMEPTLSMLGYEQ